MDEIIIKNHIKTKLEYDLLELYFTKSYITINDAFHFKLPNSLDNEKGLILLGRGPIWLYLIVYKKIKDANAASWVAQYDATTSTAVKFEETSEKNAIIKLEEFSNYLPAPKNQKVIAFIGPPHSGKTVFMYALFNQLLALNPVYIHRNFFVIKGCPDGEAHWSAELPQTLVKKIRDKRAHTDEFADEVVMQIDSALKLKKIIFVDCGGKIDDRNKYILSKCSHAIIVSSKMAKSVEWKSEIKNIEYIAEIDSYLNIPGKISNIRYIEKDTGTFNMDMIGLERGNNDIYIPEDFLQYFLKE